MARKVLRAIFMVCKHSGYPEPCADRTMCVNTLVAANMKGRAESLTLHWANMNFAMLARSAGRNESFDYQFDARFAELAHRAIPP
jgi:hypothetical protein